MPKLTPWFPPEIKPVRIGWYECEICVGRGTGERHYWDGSDWNWKGTAILMGAGWRGLSRPATRKEK